MKRKDGRQDEPYLGDPESSIDLNVSVLTDRDGSAVPLADQFGIHIFAIEAETQIQHYIQTEKDMNEIKSRQKQELEREQAELITINRGGYRAKVIALCLLLAAGAGLAAFLVYQTLWLYYPQKRALMAERAYMENNLTMVVDALQPIPVEQMDVHEKYLLAVVYIRGQSVDSFDLDTKERLIARLSYHGDSKLLDYWIYLGRLEVDQALDVAMRISDHQLLLYAYLQKLEQVKSDTELKGEEKVQQMDTLRSKIKTLADELGIQYEDKQAGGEDVQ